MKIENLLNNVKDDANVSNEIVRLRAIYLYNQAIVRDLLKANQVEAVKLVEEKFNSILENI